MRFVFLIIVKVLKDYFLFIYFFWGMEQEGIQLGGREGFFSYFSYCVHFLFQKKLLCLEKLVTHIFYMASFRHVMTSAKIIALRVWPEVKFLRHLK